MKLTSHFQAFGIGPQDVSFPVMGIIGTIIIGFFAGLIARFIKPGNDSMGFIMTTILGIVGAIVGSYLGQAFGIYRVGEPAGFVGAVIGAIILLSVIKMASHRSA